MSFRQAALSWCEVLPEHVTTEPLAYLTVSQICMLTGPTSEKVLKIWFLILYSNFDWNFTSYGISFS